MAREILKLAQKMRAIDEKLISRWKLDVVRRVKRFARNASSASPFLAKPQKSIFGGRISKKGDSVVFYGTPPNAGRMKGFSAPTNEWIPTSEPFRFFGEDGWRTIHKVQKTAKSVGVALQDVSYFGTASRPERYFGIKSGRVSLGYGKTKNDESLPIYAKESFADWLFGRYADDVDEIILECGQNILDDYLLKNGD